MLKKIFFLSVALLSQGALAFDEGLYQEVLKDMGSATKILSRPVLMYHRFHNESLKQLPPNDSYWLNSVVKYRGPKYFSFEATNDKFGPGIYAAVDPTASTPFGPLVAEIEIAAGAAFLDTRTGTWDLEDGLVLRKTTYQALLGVCENSFKPINPKPYYKDGVEWVLVYKPDVYKGATCRQYFNQAMRDLKIQFVVYDWYSPENTPDYDPPCTGDAGRAFVVTGVLLDDQRMGENLQNFDFSAMTVRGFNPKYQFSQKFSEDPSLRRAEKLALLENPDSDFTRYFFMNEFNRISDPTNLGKDHWSIFDEITELPASSKTLETIKNSRFMCDSKTFLEDRSPVFKKKKP
jgi:hypothetical protein